MILMLTTSIIDISEILKSVVVIWSLSCPVWFTNAFITLVIFSAFRLRAISAFSAVFSTDKDKVI